MSKAKKKYNLKKGDYTRNPETGRPIRIGGRVFNKLVAEGKVENPQIEDDDIIDEFADEKEADEKIKKINKSEKLPKNKYAVKGRGRYKNKIVPAHKRNTSKPKPKRSKQEIILDLISGLEEDEIMPALANAGYSKKQVEDMFEGLGDDNDDIEEDESDESDEDLQFELEESEESEDDYEDSDSDEEDFDEDDVLEDEY